MIIRHYVEFFFDDYNTVEEVKSGEPSLDDVPDGAYALRLFDMSEREIGDGKYLVSGKRENVSPFKFQGQAYNLKAMKCVHPDQKEVIEKMEKIGAEWAIKTLDDKWHVLF